MTTQPSLRRLWPIAFPLGVLLVHAAVSAGYTIDDAWISFRYARNLVEGHGLTFNIGESPVEGYTNFAWVLLAAIVIAAGLPVGVVMPAIGVIAAAALLVVVVRAAASLSRGEDGDARAGGPLPPPPGLVAGLLVATFQGVAFHAVAGLETTLFALVHTVAALALVQRRGLAFGLATGAAFLLRPEAALLGVFGVGLLAARAPRRSALEATASMGAIVLPFLALKLAIFGSIIPNTALAKTPSLLAGLEYVLVEGQPLAPFVLAAGLAYKAAGTKLRELTAIAGLEVVGVVLEGGDWMEAARFLVPVVPLLAIVADRPVRGWLRLEAPRVLSAAGVLLLLPYLGLMGLAADDMARAIGPARARRALRGEVTERMVAEGVHSIALVDVGFTGWVGKELTIVDLGGLTDATIAAGPGGLLEKRPDPAYLASRDPERVILTSSAASREEPGYYLFEVEHHVAATPWFRDGYEAEAEVDADPTYRMHIFRRRLAPTAQRPLH